jgi:hypothetical protein
MRFPVIMQNFWQPDAPDCGKRAIYDRKGEKFLHMCVRQPERRWKISDGKQHEGEFVGQMFFSDIVHNLI